jgi:hypothetical protein
MLRRWTIALAALGAGAAVTATLLVYTGSQARGQAVFVVAHDLAAGAPLTSDAVRLGQVRLGDAGAAVLGPGAERLLLASRAAHDLVAGQLLQRSDLATGDAGPDRRRVLVPVKDPPPVAGGDRVDLLLVSSAPDRVTVSPFVFNLEVVAVSPAGLVVSAPSRAAPALVWAATNLHLVAVVADPGARPGQEQAVSSLEQAEAALGR